MKQLTWIGVLCIGLSQATGCFITTDDNDDVRPCGRRCDTVPPADRTLPPADAPSGDLDVVWNADPDCGPATTAQVISIDLDTDDQFEDLFDCEDGGGLTFPLPLGDYEVVVNLTDDSTNTVFAVSDIQEAALLFDGDVVELDYDILTDAAFFGLSWSLIDAGDGLPITCLEAEADGVSALATLVDSGGTFVDTEFPCEDGEGVTDPLILGDWTVSVSVLDDLGGGIGDPSMALVRTLDVGNEIVDLGDFTFEL